jgi:GNAT superfamily N-acetyltransferase
MLKYIKVISIFNRMEALHKKYALSPHYFLSSIGVSPKYQGKGLASRLIKPILLKADENGMGVYLETLTPGNVPIYQHFGFKIMEKVEFRKENLTLWALYRPSNE